MALATVARKAGDEGKTADVHVEATLDADGADTDCGGISLTPAQETRHCMLPTGYYGCFWSSSYFWCRDPQRPCENSQRFANREQLIRKDQQATMHEKGNTTQKPCKSPKGHPAGHLP